MLIHKLRGRDPAASTSGRLLKLGSWIYVYSLNGFCFWFSRTLECSAAAYLDVMQETYYQGPPLTIHPKKNSSLPVLPVHTYLPTYDMIMP
jgi:hypothetical protein